MSDKGGRSGTVTWNRQKGYRLPMRWRQLYQCERSSHIKPTSRQRPVQPLGLGYRRQWRWRRTEGSSFVVVKFLCCCCCRRVLRRGEVGNTRCYPSPHPDFSRGIFIYPSIQIRFCAAYVGLSRWIYASGFNCYAKFPLAIATAGIYPRWIRVSSLTWTL